MNHNFNFIKKGVSGICFFDLYLSKLWCTTQWGWKIKIQNRLQSVFDDAAFGRNVNIHV